MFSTEPGSVEMPSAGRPFTHEVITRLVARGVGVAPVTLHTGFSSQEAGEAPQPEWYDVPGATARLVTSTRAAGGRVVAVGTTVTRALESAADDGRVLARHGWTERVVTPADPPQVVDGLITGWHDPGASHLLLYALIFAMPLSGWLMSSARGFPVAWFNQFTFPDLVARNETLYRQLQDLHHLLFSVLVCVALLHIAGALKHHFIDRNDVLKRMLPFGGEK